MDLMKLFNLARARAEIEFPGVRIHEISYRKPQQLVVFGGCTPYEWDVANAADDKEKYKMAEYSVKELHKN
jgi:hypothetical protein